MEPLLIGCLSGGTVLMFGVLLLLRRWYSIKLWKTILFGILLTCMGLLGTKLLRYVESGTWTGESFFGAIFITPILMLVIGWILRIPGRDTLDLCAPAEMAMLAVMKIRCLCCGCCRGRILRVTEAKEVIRFPSQWVELVTGILLAAAMILLIRKGIQKGRIYPISMVSYGIVRFILNCFRETTPFVWILPAGNFWSLIAIATGLLWLRYLKKHPQQKEI